MPPQSTWEALPQKRFGLSADQNHRLRLGGHPRSSYRWAPQSGNCSLARWRRHDVAGVSVWSGRWPANAWPAYETAGDPSLMRPRAREAMPASTARITETPNTTVSP